MNELVLPSRNKAYGFYGQMMTCALRDRPMERIWTVTSALIGLATSAGTQDEMCGIRDFLDSSMGRHFADDVIEALQGGTINNEIEIIKVIEKWQGWTVSNETQQIEGIPAGLPYLAGWVQHFAILAASDTAD